MNHWTYIQNLSVLLYQGRTISVFDAIKLYVSVVQHIEQVPEYLTCPLTHRWATLCIEALDDILIEALLRHKKRKIRAIEFQTLQLFDMIVPKPPRFYYNGSTDEP